MRAYVEIWAHSDNAHSVDVAAVLAAVRAVPGVVRADWYLTPDDLVAIVEFADEGAFEEAIDRIEAIPDCSVSTVRLARNR